MQNCNGKVCENDDDHGPCNTVTVFQEEYEYMNNTLVNESNASSRKPAHLACSSLKSEHKNAVLLAIQERFQTVEQLSTDNDEFIFIVDCNNDRALQQSMHTRNYSLKCDRQFNAFCVLLRNQRGSRTQLIAQQQYVRELRLVLGIGVQFIVKFC